mgnify:CR=1 FL=1
MARADVSSIAIRILPQGVRPDANQIAEIEKAIDATIVDVGENATYADEMIAKQKNADEAVKKLQGGTASNSDSKPKSKTKK